MQDDRRFDGDARDGVDGTPMSYEPGSQVNQAEEGFTASHHPNAGGGIPEDPDTPTADMTPEDTDGIGFDDDHDNLQAATGDFFNMPSFDQAEAALRSRRKMKITILVAVVVVVALVIAAYFILSGQQQERRSDAIVNDELISDDDIDSSTRAGSDYATTIPGLTSLIGMSLSDVSSSLGTDYITYVAATNPDDETTSITLVYSPSDVDVELEGAPQIVLEADDDDNVSKVVLTSEMEMVGVNVSSFSELVESSEVINWLLEQAGISDGIESYTAPSADTYTTYVDEEAEELVVSMESYTFSGSIEGASAPSSWQLVLTFDYEQVNSGQAEEPVKTIQITLE